MLRVRDSTFGLFMQTADRAIKIIKREQRNSVLLEDGVQAEPVSKTENEIKREILNTITSWIEHQKEAKKELLRQSSLFKRAAL